MNYLEIIQDLEALVTQRGIRIRYEKGDFEGGYCILKEQQILVVNKKLHEMRKAAVLAQALGEIGIDSIFVKPAIRAFIEDEVSKIMRQK